MKFAVIGGGPAGYSAALEAVKYGWDVVLFEKDLMGGICLNRGCVPTNFFLHAAQIIERLKKAEREGIFISSWHMDFLETQKHKNQVISTLRENLIQQIQANKIKIISGPAVLLDKNHILCGDNIYESDTVLVATGAKPSPPLISGARNSDQLLECEEIPENLYILGGGVIAAEFASIFNTLGSHVTIFIRGKGILRKWDKEIALALTQLLKRQGVNIQTNCDFSQLEFSENSFILSATGRIPNLEGLNSSLFSIGSTGGILVNDWGRTGTDNIYAAGDVLDKAPQLAHISIEQGKRVAKAISGIHEDGTIDTVQTIFVGQEAATVGLTEEEAIGQGITVVSAKQTMYSNAMNTISSGERGFVKLIADAETGRVIGGQWLGERAGDLISEIALAVNEELTVNDLCSNIRPHPSYCEALTQVSETLRSKLK